jgi:hypothetical protein
MNRRFVAFEVLSGCYEELHCLGYNAPQPVERQPAIRRRHVPSKRRLSFNGLNGIISQKTELFNRRFVHHTECDAENIWRDEVLDKKFRNVGVEACINRIV